MSKKEILILAGIAVLFLALRLPGVWLPLHQDEYKWPMIVNPEITEPGGIPHPPVGEFIYRAAGQIIGYDNFRFVPLAFSFLNLFLLFYLVKIIFDTRTALWSAGLFTISFYSALASLMVDTDGAIMPMFFLATVIGYVRLKRTELKIKNHELWIWGSILTLAAILGFLVKTSFVIAIAAIVLDFAVEKNVFSDRRKFTRYLLAGLGVFAGLGALLLAAKFIFPAFRLEWTLNYWSKFVNFGDRGWLQIFIQSVKSLLYISPLLLLPLVFIDREIFRKTRLFFLFIFIGLFFYLAAFDFSAGALDRYLQFLIVPLCVIAGAVLAKYLNYESRIMNYAPMTIVAISIFSLQFFNHFTPPLYPKAEWIGRILSLKWNFLFPFMGGSGPVPFYISFAFIGLIWICSFIFVFGPKMRKFFSSQPETHEPKFPYSRTALLVGLLVLGLLYNGVFIEEYLFGKINGSAPGLIRRAADFIAKNEDIKKVTVYNDNGGDEITKTGKYRKRLYVDPKFDVEDKIKTLNQYKEHYLVIDIPHLDPRSVYAKYFNSCQLIYKERSGNIYSYVYNCQNAPNISIK